MLSTHESVYNAEKYLLSKGKDIDFIWSSVYIIAQKKKKKAERLEQWNIKSKLLNRK
jgi:hypothetical protein